MMDVEIRTIDGHVFSGGVKTFNLGAFTEELSKNDRGYLVLTNESGRQVCIKKTAIASIVQK